MIEGALRKSGAVQQVFVHGEPGASALVAVAVPAEALLREAAERGQSAAPCWPRCRRRGARAGLGRAAHSRSGLRVPGVAEGTMNASLLSPNQVREAFKSVRRRAHPHARLRWPQGARLGSRHA